MFRTKAGLDRFADEMEARYRDMEDSDDEGFLLEELGLGDSGSEYESDYSGFVDDIPRRSRRGPPIPPRPKSLISKKRKSKKGPPVPKRPKSLKKKTKKRPPARPPRPRRFSKKRKSKKRKSKKSRKSKRKSRKRSQKFGIPRPWSRSPGFMSTTRQDKIYELMLRDALKRTTSPDIRDDWSDRIKRLEKKRKRRIFR